MIETARLTLRAWREGDRDLFHHLCNDPDTMRYLGPLRTRDEDDEAFDRQRAFFATVGTCGWLVERRCDARAIGMCGAKPARSGLPIAGEMEIGWRFAPDYRGQGYALEAARASLDHVWVATDSRHVVAITVHDNFASRRLMERLGMHYVPDGDFGHPFIAVDSPLYRHVLYRVDRPVDGG